jgi:hypothetical protein
MEDVGGKSENEPCISCPLQAATPCGFVPCWLLRHMSWDAGDGVNGKVVWERSAEEEFVGKLARAWERSGCCHEERREH